MPSRPSRATLLRTLHDSAARFDAASNAQRRDALRRLSALPLKADATLGAYHDTLLFLAAHPPDAATLAQVEREFRRIARFLKALRGSHPAVLAERGLPWVDTVTRFSHDCVRWLLGLPQVAVSIDSFGEALLDLNAVLKLTLPSIERGETTAGYDNDGLLTSLKVRPSQRLAFLVNELSRLDDRPLVKDQLFEALDLYVRVAPRSERFSKACNRLPVAAPFFPTENLRRFDAAAVMDTPLPPPLALDEAERQHAIDVIRLTMTLTARETDPATYLDASTLRLYELGRGLTCALFGMVAARQLPLESYIGFTLFRNGFPVAYGGSWILGERATFGMNIFEPYRGGESGYLMCQLLRCYRHAFTVRHVEVEPYQFGLDNPDGIKSGAFWFYHRYGFRPLLPELRRLAEREHRRIARGDGYRSSEATLMRFTEGNVALHFGGAVPPQLSDITARVTAMIARRYHGDRIAAERDCCEQFNRLARWPHALNTDEQRALAEVALVWRALDVKERDRIDLLAQMVTTKPRDPWRYQALLRRFFAGSGLGVR